MKIQNFWRKEIKMKENIIQEQWEGFFNAPYPDVLQYSVKGEVVVIPMSQLKEFIDQYEVSQGKWREINLYTGLVAALIRVYIWCKENGRHEFTRKEIKDKLLLSENDTARWGDWILFGEGMVYKPEGKGSWGLHTERVAAFIRGEWEIPIKIAKRGKEIKILEKGLITDIKQLHEYLNEDMKYIAKYLPKNNLFNN